VLSFLLSAARSLVSKLGKCCLLSAGVQVALQLQLWASAEHCLQRGSRARSSGISAISRNQSRHFTWRPESKVPAVVTSSG
jgi:hypothetical protein